jgi:hypothetical protein
LVMMPQQLQASGKVGAQIRLQAHNLSNETREVVRTVCS